MRTTLKLEVQAYEAAKSKAMHENISLGEAVSALIMQSLRQDPVRRRKGARAVFRSDGGTYSSATVEEALADD